MRTEIIPFITMWCIEQLPSGLLFVVGKIEVSRILWNFAYYIILWNSKEDRAKEGERERERKSASEKTRIVQSNNCKLLLSSYESPLEFRRRIVSFPSVFDDFRRKTCKCGRECRIFLLCFRWKPRPLWTCNRTSLASAECLAIFLASARSISLWS